MFLSLIFRIMRKQWLNGSSRLKMMSRLIRIIDSSSTAIIHLPVKDLHSYIHHFSPIERVFFFQINDIPDDIFMRNKWYNTYFYE